MPQNYQYYEASPYAEMFEPSIDDAAAKLKHAVSNYAELKEKFSPPMKEKVQNLTWDNVTKQIIDLMVV